MEHTAEQAGPRLPREVARYEPVLVTNPDMLDVFEVAALLRMDPETVRRLIRTHKLPAAKIGSRWRVQRHHVIDLMGGTGPPVTPRDRRRELLGDETVRYLEQLAADAIKAIARGMVTGFAAAYLSQKIEQRQANRAAVRQAVASQGVTVVV